jgi:hypothetical protein
VQRLCGASGRQLDRQEAQRQRRFSLEVIAEHGGDGILLRERHADGCHGDSEEHNARPDLK